MANQFPTIVPTGYAGDVTDFLKTKCERNGDVRLLENTVSVPGSTVAATIVGLFPFNKGFKLSYGSAFYADALDTNTTVTVSLGYYYLDSTLTSSSAAFLSASTAARAGGIMLPNVKAGMTWVAAGDGWIVLTTAAATTTTTGLITTNALGAYDTGGLTL